MAIKTNKMSDERYEMERDKLIPFAEAYANTEVGEIEKYMITDERIDKSILWSKCFHIKMNKLAREKGLV